MIVCLTFSACTRGSEPTLPPGSTTTTGAPSTSRPPTTTITTPTTTQEPSTSTTEPGLPDDPGVAVIAEFIAAWKAGDRPRMLELNDGIGDADIDWLLGLGSPAGDPYECRRWGDDDGPVAQCYVEVPDHGQYEEETHYVLARPGGDGTWRVAWASVVTP
ncbi:MAG TPA: hypothetical protein VF246_11420 [Acidimicrobiia bacterium]